MGNQVTKPLPEDIAAGHPAEAGAAQPFAGVQLAVLARDPAQAKHLSAALRELGAVVMVASESAPDWTCLRAFDPDLTLVDDAGAETVLPVLRGDARLRFSRLLGIPVDFEWPGHGDPCGDELLGQLTDALRGHTELRDAIASAPRAETALRVVGAGHLLRMVARTGRAHRVTFRFPDGVITTDIADGLLWGADSEFGDGHGDPVAVLRQLLSLGEADVSIERCSRPKLGNLMLPVEAALSLAVPPERGSAGRSVQRPSRQTTLKPQPIEPVTDGRPRDEPRTIHPRADELRSASLPPADEAQIPGGVLQQPANDASPLAGPPSLPAADAHRVSLSDGLVIDMATFSEPAQRVSLSDDLVVVTDPAPRNDAADMATFSEPAQRASLSDDLVVVTDPAPRNDAPEAEPAAAAATEQPQAGTAERQPPQRTAPGLPPSVFPALPGRTARPPLLALAAGATVALFVYALWQGGTDGDDGSDTLAAADAPITASEGESARHDGDPLDGRGDGDPKAEADAETHVEAAMDDVDVASARKHFLAALALDPEHTQALRGLAEFDLAAHRLPAAVRWAKRLVDTSPKVGAHHRLLGDAYAAQHRMPRARVSWARGSKLGDPVATARLAGAYRPRSKGDGDEQGLVIVKLQGAKSAEAYVEGALVGVAPGVFILPVGSHVIELVTPKGKMARTVANISDTHVARAKVAF